MRLSKFSQLGYKILFVVAQNVLVMAHKGKPVSRAAKEVIKKNVVGSGRVLRKRADEPEPEPEPEPEVARMI